MHLNGKVLIGVGWLRTGFSMILRLTYEPLTALQNPFNRAGCWQFRNEYPCDGVCVVALFRRAPYFRGAWVRLHREVVPWVYRQGQMRGLPSARGVRDP